MKKLIVLLLIGFCFVSCEREPEFFIDGIGYYTRTRCVDSVTEIKYGYHYGMGYDGKMGYRMGSYTETTCIEHRTDSIAILKKD